MGVVWTLLTTESSLNVLVALSVIFFVAFQCRSLLVGQPKNGGKTSRVESEKKIETRKEFADKQIPYHAVHLSEEEMLKNSQFFYERMKARRSVRCFSSQAVPFKVIQNLIKTAGTAPSGANLQPWTFAVIASDQMKRRIREIVEAEEQLNYTRRMGAKWVLDVSHLNVNWNKPYLTEAPFVIAVLKQVYQIKDDGGRQPTYYNEMSTCIAVGLLLAAIQNAGLVTVTTTPLNAGGQIRALLQRPVNEKVILLLPVGYPADNVLVPDISRKSLEEIIKIY